MLEAGLKRGKLNGTDLPSLPQCDRAAGLLAKFSLWATDNQRRRPQRSGSSTSGGSNKATDQSGPMLVALMVRIQPAVFWRCFGFGWLFLACMFTDPLILNRLLDSASANDSNDGHGDSNAMLRRNLLYALILATSMTVRVICMEMCYFYSVRMTNNARSALTQAVYRRALRVSSSSGAASVLSDGQLTNLMATDCDKLGKVDWFGWFVCCWTWAVVSLPATVYFLWALVGPAAFVGTAAMVLGAALNRSLGRLTQPFVRRLLERRDARAEVLAELLRGARASKLEAWEDVWELRLKAARDLELDELKVIRYLDALNCFVGALVALSIPASVFSYYTVGSHELLGQKNKKKSVLRVTPSTSLLFFLKKSCSVPCLLFSGGAGPVPGLGHGVHGACVADADAVVGVDIALHRQSLGHLES
jgi:ABC-type multidrug transport system fused ATPase/permease subunit